MPALRLALLLAIAPLAQALALDPAKVTDFASLEQAVAELAAQPFKPRESKLDPYFTAMKYDDHRQIRFDATKAHFADSGSYRLEFFHPGWTATKTVGMHELGKTAAKPIAYDPQLFDWGQLKLPKTVAYPDGFAGFRVLAPDKMLDRRFEFLVFLGASYFRAVTTELGYGLSARGVAINTIGGEPEEFPDFTDFWFVPPSKAEPGFRCFALLDGPSVVAAYEFSAVPGKTTAMHVRGTLHLRRAVKSLGISPFSSMYWFGENAHPKPYDFRPEVHDSDGLQIETRDGKVLWRPLDNSRDLRLSLFDAVNISGFGLAERDRDFRNFEDLEAGYHRRPAVWVEPETGFEKGKIVLVEIPTGEETWDNIVAYYQPDELPTVAKPLRFAYKLNWLDQHEPAGGLAKVISTRRGFVMKSEEHLYILDFTAGSAAKDKAKDWLPEVTVKVTGGDKAKVVDARVMHNPETKGYRAFFRLDIPAESKLLELEAELKDKAHAISERWVYQWRR